MKSIAWALLNLTFSHNVIPIYSLKALLTIASKGCSILFTLQCWDQYRIEFFLFFQQNPHLFFDNCHKLFAVGRKVYSIVLHIYWFSSKNAHYLVWFTALGEVLQGIKAVLLHPFNVLSFPPCTLTSFGLVLLNRYQLHSSASKKLSKNC